MLRKPSQVPGLMLAAVLAATQALTAANPPSSPKESSVLLGGISMVPNVATMAVSAVGDPSEVADDPVHSAQVDAQLAASDSHFNLGRQAYFNGDYATARREFDEAINFLLTVPDSAPDRRRVERRLFEISDVIYRFDIEKLGAGQAEEEAVVYDKAPIDEISHMTFPVDPKLTPKLQGELNRTESGIPLELADPVQGFVNYFSTPGGRMTLLTGFRRAGRYRSMIERIFAEEGVPQELIYLAQAESAFLPRSVSHKQAVGIWQFIGETGARYRLLRTSGSDDRMDPEKATRAAARYLRDLHQRYGDWYLAMAAYNCGEGGVDRAVERTGYADYWELLKRHALPRETSRYVPIILAITIMAKNPEDYGLQNIETDSAIEYDTFRITAKTNLNLIADATMQPLSTIRDLNPGVLGLTAPEGYEVHVPKGAGDSTLAVLESVPAVNRVAWRLHHVTANDTLATIAKTYNTPPERILAVNSGQTENLTAGDTLLIPASYEPEPASAKARRSTGRSRRSGGNRVAKAVAPRRGTHVSASRRVPSTMLHRSGTVTTASLHR